MAALWGFGVLPSVRIGLKYLLLVGLVIAATADCWRPLRGALSCQNSWGRLLKAPEGFCQVVTACVISLPETNTTRCRKILKATEAC